MQTPTRDQDTDALLQRITRRIVEAVDPERVILFGSRAKGTASDASDIDLCVIAEHDGERRELSRKIQSLFPRRNFAMDLIVRSPSEYGRERQLINSIGYFIEQHGRTLYSEENAFENMEDSPKSEHDDWTKRWFEKAERDLQTARRVLEDDPFPDVACFHAQQCAEKCLKGYLTAKGKEVEKIHNLTNLLDRCTAVDDSLENLRDSCVFLNRYAVQARYPGGLPKEPDFDEAREAVENAARVRAFVRDALDL